MSDCKSKVLSDLETQVRDKHDHENVLASELAILTKPAAATSTATSGDNKFFGGDLESAVTVMATIGDRLTYLLQTKSMFNSESFVQEIFQVCLIVIQTTSQKCSSSFAILSWILNEF